MDKRIVEYLVGETFTENGDEFVCIHKNHENVVGLNSSVIFIDKGGYINSKHELSYFVKNASGYIIKPLYRPELKLVIYETCIDYFGKMIFDETDIQNCLDFIEKLYNQYNAKNNLTVRQQEHYFK